MTKQYLSSLTGGGSVSSGSGADTNGFTMSGDIDMDGHEVVGLGDPSSDSSASNKKYVDDEIAKVGGGLDQATADNRYLQKTDASKNTRLRQTPVTLTYPKQMRPTHTFPRPALQVRTLR